MLFIFRNHIIAYPVVVDGWNHMVCSSCTTPEEKAAINVSKCSNIMLDQEKDENIEADCGRCKKKILLRCTPTMEQVVIEGGYEGIPIKFYRKT